MPILTVSNLRKFHADQEVLAGASFSLEPGEKAALIGRNGTGKTTLLRLVAGLDEPDGGGVAVVGWVRRGYLAQIPEGPWDTDVFTHVLSGAADVYALQARARELELLMATPEVHDDPVRLESVMEEYAHVHYRFEHVGGFTLETRAKMVLSGLGFAKSDYTRLLGALSGGWRVRAELARVLLTEPDLVLLDEPTNHLDLAATEWLEQCLQSFSGAALVVSHDRRLIDAVTSRTLELEDGRVASYPGPYSVYVELKEQQVRLQQEAWDRQQEEIVRLEAYIRRYKAGNRAKQAKSREKRLARVEASRLAAPKARAVMRPSGRSAPVSGRLIARLQNVAKRYGEVEVFRNLDLEIYRGERIGLLGSNGTGKSTLLKMIAGLEPPTSGQVTTGIGVHAAYFAQESTDTLDPSNTVLDEILADRPMSPEQVRTYLGRFLFTGEEVFKHVAMLSGGERQRLSLAKLLLDKSNLVLLDEPSNHLDIPAREALEASLQEFPGTIIVATHDRYLLERLATRIFTLQGRTVVDFHGTYRELRERRPYPLEQDRGREVEQHFVSSGDKPTTHQGARRPSAFGRGRATRPAGPTFDEVASEIMTMERELEDVGKRLADPELYRDAERAKAMQARYKEAERRLAELYEMLDAIEENGS